MRLPWWAYSLLHGMRVLDDQMHYPSEVPNRAAGIFRMAGHMLGERLLLRLGHESPPHTRLAPPKMHRRAPLSQGRHPTTDR
jgi:hypothetical protein